MSNKRIREARPAQDRPSGGPGSMDGIELRNQYSPDPNVLERKAAAYLQRQNRSVQFAGEPGTDRIEQLSKVERWAVIWAAVAGIISGGVIGGSEAAMRFWYFNGMEELGWRVQLPYWIGFYVFAGIISAIEILFLYANSLRAAAKVSRIAGISFSEGSRSDLVAMGLARAALEFPNPRIEIFGVDPYARMPNWRLRLKSIVYRLKVGVSTFALRVFLRRLVGRVAVRGLIPLLAGPVYAVWNGLITWRIVRESRVRSFGPGEVDAIVSALGQNGHRLSPKLAQVVLHGTGELIMRGCDAHPNYILLLGSLLEQAEAGEDLVVDWESARKELHELSQDERGAALDLLTLASLLGSYVQDPQEDFVRELHSDCGLELRPRGLKRLRRKLMQGESVTAEDLQDIRG